jgi:16S rRNA (adenine1518-N6/adenine1519-N6)-dimethyltransferase
MHQQKKSLGQHYLIDKNIARKIVNSLEGRTHTILEIGPGQGILTGFLVEKGTHNVSAVEIDKDNVSYIEQKYPGLEGHVIHKDILRFNFDEFFNEPFSVIGNLPYNVASQILFRLLEHKDLIPEIVVMIQKEMAERLVAKKGTKAYGILSVLFQTYYDIEISFNVSKNVFSPPPKVTSAVIRANRNNRDNLACDESLFKEIVKTSFNQRRKILRNSLKSILLNLSLESDMLLRRPEMLNIQDFIFLAEAIGARRK